VLQDKN
jgi:hypothetical protein